MERAISMNQVGKLTLQVLLLSVMSRRFGMLVILPANFVAAFLAITVSAIYDVVPIPHVESATVQQANSFNFDIGDLSMSENQASATTRLFETTNLPYSKVGLLFFEIDALFPWNGINV